MTYTILPPNVVDLHRRPVVGSSKAMSDDLHCKVCHRQPGDSIDLCTWWPAACQHPHGPRPQRCWRCCDEDQRLDLVDAGCPTAIDYVRHGEPSPSPAADESSGGEVS